jgi:hypothetical protein
MVERGELKMKVYLFLYRMDGYPHIAWIKEKHIADVLGDYLAHMDAMYVERFEYSITESDIAFSDHEFIGDLIDHGFLSEEK